MDSLTTEQARPIPNEQPETWPLLIEEVRNRRNRLCGGPPDWKPEPAPVWELLLAEMAERDQHGRQRYGVPLQAHNGRDSLRDAYEESLDLAVYLMNHSIESPSCNAGLRVRMAVDFAYAVRAMIFKRDGR